MDPSIIGGVGIGASILGGLVGAGGSIMDGLSKSSMYSYQSGVAKTNQRIMSQNADYARYTGEVDAAKSGMQTRARVGQTIAGFAGSGIDVGSGSHARVVESEGDVGRSDQAIIRMNAARRAYGYDVEAAKYGAESKMYDSASSTALVAGGIGAASSILGTVGSVSSKWLQGNTVGLWGSGGDFPLDMGEPSQYNRLS